MSSLAGLVNYSDDENSSSSDEQQEKPPVEPSTQTSPSLTTKEVQHNIKTLLPNRADGSINDYNRRLQAALTPRPIDGIENWGIPGELTTPCDPEQTERIAHFLSLKASGHHLNEHLQHNKSFRNPRIYAKLVEFTEVDEIGSNFDKAEFDPHGFPKEMYIDGILETQRRLAEEKAAQQQNRSSINFVPQQPQELTPQQSNAMAQAMATAAKIASRIAKPPVLESKSPMTTAHAASNNDKRKIKWDDESGSSKRR
ncbi:MAG: HCNGP-like protein-domain-containing protein [Benjaminiella poitrasii]|nr:MAG: HCNGP-like protein-domain-containing protein [Benjaminiella poitrasii]